MSDIEEKKYHKLDPKKKPLYLAILLFFFLVVFPTIFYFYVNFALERPAQNIKEVIFKVHRGESASQISARLYEQNLINSKFLFNAYLLITKNQSNLQAGVYKIPVGINIKDLVKLLSKGTDDVRITFVEGLRVEEIAEKVAQNFVGIDYEEFVDKAKPYEGKLFPDTYEFRAYADAEEIIKIMRRNFEDKVGGLLNPEALSKAGLNKEEVLILASIVEREVNKEEDRKIVAGILIKRYKERMSLGADATVQYAVAPKFENGKKVWWPKNLTWDDLNSDFPFNTRKNIGLPPTPICNPGLSSIEAVLNPTETKFYYYLTDPSGITHYAVTYEEHNNNIYKYLK